MQVSLEWPGLPAGVKFDPTDVELIQHLAGKIGLINSKSHIFIDEFIPTLEEDQGICYTHPKNLPGTDMPAKPTLNALSSQSTFCFEYFIASFLISQVRC